MSMSKKSLPVWKIKGLSLPFKYDFDDLESMESYEAIFKNMDKKTSEMKNCKTRAEGIKVYCDAFFEAFDCLFGEGTADKLFQGKYNMKTCDSVYEQYIKFVSECVAATDQSRLQKFQRYLGKKPSDHKHKKKPYHA